jgi:hypothetical protein
MKTVMSLAVLSVACYATADVQKIQYAYDDSKAEYSIVSFTESGSTLQVTVQFDPPGYRPKSGSLLHQLHKTGTRLR